MEMNRLVPEKLDIQLLEKKIPEKVDENFIKADKIGHEMYLLFVDKRLIKEKSDFFNPLKRLILKQD